MRFLSLLALLFSLSAQAMPSWVNSSHTILMPQSVSDSLGATNEFPLFWWNFLILEIKDDHSWDQVDRFCKSLNNDARDLIRKTGCGQDLAQYRDVLKDWAADESLRGLAPSPVKLRAAFQEALTKASLPGDQNLMFLLRTDPLESYRDLQKIIDSRMQLKLEKRHGFFFDAESRRVVIPIQLAFPPIESKKTASFLDFTDQALKTAPDIKRLGVIGPHYPSLMNERQILKDVKQISVIGTILLFLQVFAAIALGRWRLLLLVPPVLFSTGITTVLIVLIFGSIHGLTLSFGPGIVGLCMDHGLHSCLNPKWKGAWKANWYGLLTTVVALVTMLLSSIPFLRQLMAFSIIGLFLGFGIYWLLHRKYPHVFEVKPWAIEPRPSRAKLVFTFLMMLSFVAGIFVLRPNFSMQQMNYQTQDTADLNIWFFMHLKTRSPLLNISKGDALTNAFQERALAQKENLQLENIANFLPLAAEQSENLKSWTALCAQPRGATEAKFFAPFWQNVCSNQPKDLNTQKPAYLSDFNGQQKWVSLWMTKDADEAAKVKAQFPAAQSIPEIVAGFQTLLEKETAWMAPVSILLAMALLMLYYRNAYLVALSLVPFFVGLGVFAGAAMLFHFEISFISLIAVVMIFGLSLDYGIFATNLYTGRSGPSAPGVWTSVALAALVTFLGFLPLIFSAHPVLLQLGQALVWGTAGTILGSVWGIPCIHHFLKARHET